MKLINIIVILLLIPFVCNSQSDSLKLRNIEITAFKIDEISTKKLTKEKFRKDSILLKLTRYQNKTEILSFFDKSKSELKTEFYYDNSNLILIRFSEKSPLFKNDIAINFTEFYFDCGKLINEYNYWQLPSTALCAPTPVGNAGIEYFGYNKNFTNEFLYSYSKILLDYIETD